MKNTILFLLFAFCSIQSFAQTKAERERAWSFTNVSQQIFATNLFADVTTGTYTIPSKGVWLLRYDLSTDGTGANTNSHVAITDASNNVIAGTERARGGGITTTQILSGEAIVTTTGATTYKVRCRSGGTGSMTILSSAVTQSTISLIQLSE